MAEAQAEAEGADQRINGSHGNAGGRVAFTVKETEAGAGVVELEAADDVALAERMADGAARVRAEIKKLIVERQH